MSDGSRKDNGSEFQSVVPETAKHLWPYLVVLDVSSATHFMPLLAINHQRHFVFRLSVCP